MKLKISYKVIILLTIMLNGSLIAIAQDFEADGIYYAFFDVNHVRGVQVVNKIYGSVDYTGSYSGDVVIPSTVVYNGTTYPVHGIGSYAFAYCTDLTSVTIPNSMKSINECAFFNCRNLESVRLPYSVIFIGKKAFYYCEKLSNFTCLAVTPPSMGDYFSIYPAYYMVTLHVPEKSLEAYKATDWWGCFIDIVGDANEDSNTPNPPVTDKCDTNDDGEVNIADVNRVIDAILGH